MEDEGRAKSAEASPVLWTAWADYFATGEGRTIMGCITYADSEQQMRASFANRFGEYFAKGCEVDRGVARNKVARFLWSEDLLVAIESCEPRHGFVDAQCSVHVNFS